MAFLKEFKEFALKGNVMDMAVGVIIGGAFGKIVSSLVNDILMPPIGALIGNTDFSQLRLDISKVRDVTSNAMHSVGDMVTGGGDPAQAAAAAEPIYWNYGAFIQQCVDFTILALCVFLMVKLSPQAENIPEMCKAVEAAGADAISLTNTFQACAIDLEKRRPVFDNIFAGLSGPAVRPIALRMVWQAVGAVNIPVVGLGGIATGKDALEFIMAGATAVQVGAANFANPRAMETIAEEMAAWMDAHGVKTLDEIRGCAR